MMNNAIPIAGPGRSLSSAQRETLRMMLNMIVPASADGRLPAAAEIDLVVRHVAQVDGLVAALREQLDALERGAIAQFGSAFATLDDASRTSLLDALRARDPVLLQQLALETVTCYYQQDRVLEALGMEARPPYPKGYQVEQGDLSLLKPVIARGKIYRDAP
jgi:hypothetical protein